MKVLIAVAFLAAAMVIMAPTKAQRETSPPTGISNHLSLYTAEPAPASADQAVIDNANIITIIGEKPDLPLWAAPARSYQETSSSKLGSYEESLDASSSRAGPAEPYWS